MPILHTILYTFPNVLARRICLTIKRFFSYVVSSFLMSLIFDSGVILNGEIKCWSLSGIKGFRTYWLINWIYLVIKNLFYSICQVFAEDKDIGIVSGRVCKYVIEGFNLPFKVNDDGVISIDQPLGRDAYDLYEFQVDAIDCGGQMSKSSAKVAISVETVQPPCAEGQFWGCWCL